MTPEEQAREVVKTQRSWLHLSDAEEARLRDIIAAARAARDREIATWQEKAATFLHERDDALSDAWDRADVIPGGAHRDLEACLAKVPELLAKKNREIDRLNIVEARYQTLSLCDEHEKTVPGKPYQCPLCVLRAQRDALVQVLKRVRPYLTKAAGAEELADATRLLDAALAAGTEDSPPCPKCQHWPCNCEPHAVGKGKNP